MRTTTETPSLDLVFSTAVERAVERCADRLAASVHKRMLSTRRTIAYLDVSLSQLRILIDDGKLHPVKYRNDGANYFKIEELEALISAGQRGERE